MKICLFSTCDLTRFGPVLLIDKGVAPSRARSHRERRVVQSGAGGWAIALGFEFDDSALIRAIVHVRKTRETGPRTFRVRRATIGKIR